MKPSLRQAGAVLLLLWQTWALAQPTLVGEVVSGAVSEARSLPDLLQAAVRDHPSLRARRLEVGAAGSEVASARWQYWPTPSISMQRPDQPLIRGTDQSVRLISLKQPLWTGGRLEAYSALVGAREQSAQAAWREVRRDVALEVIQSWADAYASMARTQAWDKSLEVHRKMLDQIQRRTDEGLSARSDLQLAQSRLQGVLADRMSAQLSWETARDRLQTLTGLNLAQQLQASAPTGAEPLSDEDVVALAVQIDPTLERLRSESAELQAQLASSASALLPELSLTLTQRQGNVTGLSTQLMVAIESKWGAGLSNMALIQAASQRLQAKQEDIEYRTRKVAEQTRADFRLLRTNRERIQAYALALQAAQGVAQSWDRQYLAGRKSWQEVMNAARETAQTEVQLIEAASVASLAEWRLALLTRGVEWLLAPQTQAD